MPPTYYRGCWHVVSRGFLIRYRQLIVISSYHLSSLITEFYNPKAFFIHAALLGQAFAHCRRFPTAASRRSLGRVSVPVWPVTLSGRLRIVALVSRYLTNQLMRHKSILYQCLAALLIRSPCSVPTYAVLAAVSSSYPPVKARLLMYYSPVRHSGTSARVRLACIRHAASVHPEPGSNSPLFILLNSSSFV